jgi:hypothetical protein
MTIIDIAAALMIVNCKGTVKAAIDGLAVVFQKGRFVAESMYKPELSQ